jgi:hypothetical protein
MPWPTNRAGRVAGHHVSNGVSDGDSTAVRATHGPPWTSCGRVRAPSPGSLPRRPRAQPAPRRPGTSASAFRSRLEPALPQLPEPAPPLSPLGAGGGRRRGRRGSCAWRPGRRSAAEGSGNVAAAAAAGTTSATRPSPSSLSTWGASGGQRSRRATYLSLSA